MKILKSTLVCAVVSFVCSQSAICALISITPTSSFLINTGTDGEAPDSSGPANPEKDLLAIYGGSKLYKNNVGTGEEDDPFKNSYDTAYNGDNSGAEITYTGGSSITDYSAYLLVKDGNHLPYWYFFDLTAAKWNGTDTLSLSGFWPDRGEISHVTIIGKQGTTTRVPDGGTSIALLGMALLGLGGVRKVIGKR